MNYQKITFKGNEADDNKAYLTARISRSLFRLNARIFSFCKNYGIDFLLTREDLEDWTGEDPLVLDFCLEPGSRLRISLGEDRNLASGVSVYVERDSLVAFASLGCSNKAVILQTTLLAGENFDVIDFILWGIVEAYIKKRNPEIFGSDD